MIGRKRPSKKSAADDPQWMTQLQPTEIVSRTTSPPLGVTCVLYQSRHFRAGLVIWIRDFSYGLPKKLWHHIQSAPEFRVDRLFAPQ
jgi:hypothetical protein